MWQYLEAVCRAEQLCLATVVRVGSFASLAYHYGWRQGYTILHCSCACRMKGIKRHPYVRFPATLVAVAVDKKRSWLCSLKASEDIHIGFIVPRRNHVRKQRCNTHHTHIFAAKRKMSSHCGCILLQFVRFPHAIPVQCKPGKPNNNFSKPSRCCMAVVALEVARATSCLRCRHA